MAGAANGGRLFDDTAVLTALVTDDVRRGDGVTETLVMRLTLAWIRTDGHGHVKRA